MLYLTLVHSFHHNPTKSFSTTVIKQDQANERTLEQANKQSLHCFAGRINFEACLLWRRLIQRFVHWICKPPNSLDKAKLWHCQAQPECNSTIEPSRNWQSLQDSLSIHDFMQSTIHIFMCWLHHNPKATLDHEDLHLATESGFGHKVFTTG